MKLTITSILITGLLSFTLALSSCMDKYDTPVTGNAYGNNSIPEGRTISIANLKKQYADIIDANPDTYKEITEETRIEGVVIGSDESGNIEADTLITNWTNVSEIYNDASGHGRISSCRPHPHRGLKVCHGPGGTSWGGRTARRRRRSRRTPRPRTRPRSDRT